MDFRICIFFIASHSLHLVLSSTECALTFDITKCAYDATCFNIVQTSHKWPWERSRHNDYYYNGGYRSYSSGDQEHAGCPRHMTYEGILVDPVYLIFKKTQDFDYTTSVPVTSGQGGQGMMNVVYFLDLSDNNYESTPILKPMQNLVILNLSKNQLTTAVLSNENNLNKLSEIDLSYNTISDINVNSDEHPYSTLKKINMSHNYLVEIPDAVFDKMADLQTLDLSHNYIERFSPLTFEGIKNLLHLNLSNNRLTEINTFLFRFSELKDLSLSENRIKELKASAFDKLNKLEILDLSTNVIKTIDSNVFQNMILLNSLDLSNNILDATSNDTFANLQSLSSIDLSKNKFKSLPPGLFKNRTIYNFSVTDNLLEGSLTSGMFEGINVTELDLSNQLLTAIEDFAFKDLISLDTLLLSDNAIESLSIMCFKTLTSLHQLDLANNKIVSIDFNKADLTNLKSLILNKNRLVQIKHDHFKDLNSLEYLDLSKNSISQLEPTSFKSLRNLVNLRITDNPLSGTLETDTFNGLVSLPSLDISRNLLTTVQNATFNEMSELKDLNMTFSKIKDLQYNAFVNTGYIETLDLSYNELEDFFVNMSDLVGLSTLLLNNNLIKTISSTTLQGLSRLGKISLAYNALENIHNASFSSLIDLRFLDLSHNEKLIFTDTLLVKTKNLATLNVSGIKTDLRFAHFEHTAISEVVISDAGIHNISALNLSSSTSLDTLVLSNNSVCKLEIGAFSGLSGLRYLDLSFNEIYFIQPGVFKNNELLHSLNISHNSLSVISYGIFRGLIYLNTLDMSFNNIKDLQSERFYEVKSLSRLIVDHNKIESIIAENFEGTNLLKLSIGDNPLPCQILINLKKKHVSFEITAIKIDEHSGENVFGVTCNKEQIQDRIIDGSIKPTATIGEISESNDILVDIRNILYNSTNKKVNTVRDSNMTKYLDNISNVIENSNTVNNERLSNLANITSRVVDLNNNTNMFLQRILMSLQENSLVDIRNILYNSTTKKVNTVRDSNTTKYLDNISNFIEKSNTVNNERFSNLGNLASRVVDLNNNTNVLLQRILMSLQEKSVAVAATTLTPIISDNKTTDVILYIDKVKKELEKTIADLENKFFLFNYQTESLPTSHEKLVSSNEGTKSLFTETCVALILLILVCSVLHKVYKSRMFIRNRFSLSTRELPGAMENSTL